MWDIDRRFRDLNFDDAEAAAPMSIIEALHELQAWEDRVLRAIEALETLCAQRQGTCSCEPVGALRKTPDVSDAGTEAVK